MKKTIIAACALSAQAFAQSNDYAAYVAGVAAARPDDAGKINVISTLADKYVEDADKAVVLGTRNTDYVNERKISLFDFMLDGADTSCEEIDLAACMQDLVCTTPDYVTNLFTNFLDCK